MIEGWQTRYINVDRRMPILLPPDMPIGCARMTWFISVFTAVEKMDLLAAGIYVRGSGRKQYPLIDDDGAIDLLVCAWVLFKPQDRDGQLP